jgi:hypothetical protein
VYPTYLELKDFAIVVTSGEATRGAGVGLAPPTGMLSSGKVSTLCASLSSILGPFNIEKICSLVDKYYPADFSN